MATDDQASRSPGVRFFAPQAQAGAALHAPATARNRAAIAATLARHLSDAGEALEIASGTGEHAVFLAEQMPDWSWFPSDPDAAHRASIDAWRLQAPVANVHPATGLDVLVDASWPSRTFDAILCINMIHIAPFEACQALMRGASEHLTQRGQLYLYGPFKRDGAHTADSNAAFDRSLKARDPRWGVRDLENVAQTASEHGLVHETTESMPANNLSLFFRKRR